MARGARPRPRPRWSHALTAADAAVGPVMDMADIAADPHYRRDASTDRRRVGDTPMQALIARLSATPGACAGPGRPLDADGTASARTAGTSSTRPGSADGSRPMTLRSGRSGRFGGRRRASTGRGIDGRHRRRRPSPSPLRHWRCRLRRRRRPARTRRRHRTSPWRRRRGRRPCPWRSRTRRRPCPSDPRPCP